MSTNPEQQPTPTNGPQPAEDSEDFLHYRKVESEYGAEQLEHLSDLEHVRQRPAMYIGDTGQR